jgi:5-methylcytosine-specific restriction endonuclease McrA
MHRQRYADDDQYRKKIIVQNTQLRMQRMEDPEYRAEANAQRRQRRADGLESYEKEKERFRQRYTEDLEFREKMRSRGNTWKRNNPEKVKAKNKKYNSLEISRIQKRAWKLKNPFLVRLSTKRRRARIAAVYHASYTEGEVLKQLNAQNYLDFYTDEPLFNGSIKPDITEDHIIPIVNGGPDILDNIVFVKMETNSHKHTKLPSEFIAGLVDSGIITQEAADRKLNYLRERLSMITVQTWLSEWYAPNEFEFLIKEHLG